MNAPRFVVKTSHPAAIASIAETQLVSGQILGWAKKYAFFSKVQ